MAGTTPSRPKCLARLAATIAFGAALVCGARADELATFAVVNDAIPASLTGAPGDAARGRAIVVDRQTGLCLLCHAGPFPEARFQGNLAPNLAGAGERWSEGQLRLRVVDARRINPETIMPSYYRVEGLSHVARPYAGKPILNAAQIEDVVAFLTTLKDPKAR